MIRPPQYKNLINGEWVDSSSGKTSLNTNPADKQDIIGEFPDSNPEDVADAPYGPWKRAPFVKENWR